MEQLEAAFLLYTTITTMPMESNTISICHLRQAFFNHLKSCMRMPAGGATTGGSMQSGFEMGLVSAAGASELMRNWPNQQQQDGGRRQSWELRSMDDMAAHLQLESTGWGALQGKPMAISQGRRAHAGVILAGPPFTVSWGQRADLTTSLCVRFPLVLWTEEDAVILPPDDAQGIPFYLDPPGQPGYNRDIFKTWGRRVAGELCVKGFPMTSAVKAHLTAEYQSESELEEGDYPPSD